MEGVTEKRAKNWIEAGGSGNGDGWGDGSGSDWGDGDGWGSDWGDGDGWGSGLGYCSSSGWGEVDGYGWGYGNGSGDIKSFDGLPVYDIDGVQTILYRIHGNAALGAILKSDLTLEKCYVVKGEGHFAHGRTLLEAQEVLMDKIMEDMPKEARIDAFLEAFPDLDALYPNARFFDWHHRLTGSCEMGRREFAQSHGIDVEHGSMTVRDFIALTKEAYNGEIIKALEKKIAEGKEWT